MRVRGFVALVLAFGVGILAGGSLEERRGPARSEPAANQAGAAVLEAAPARTAGAPLGLSEAELRDIEIFRQASPSTVYIRQVSYRRSLFSLDVTRIEQGSGSGFLWDAQGHVVTNFHVVASRRVELLVTLADQTEWEAQVVGIAPDKDLAVLRISAPPDKIKPLALGTSADLAVGQKVLALGNPFGLDQTLTVGIVSALGRDLQSPAGRTIHDVIQTDAAINPGNSGGPLLDSSGRLVGVNAAIASPSGAFAGIGFAIPVDTVKRLVPQLIEFGQPIQPGIGVQVLPDHQARQAGLEGIVITEVVRGSPADRAGLQGLRVEARNRVTVGDVIVAVDGEEVRTFDELLDAFEDAGVGKRVRLTVSNGSQRREVEIELAEVNRLPS